MFSSILKYKSYKSFDEQSFCLELEQMLNQAEICRSHDSYSTFTDTIQDILRKYIPLK